MIRAYSINSDLVRSKFYSITPRQTYQSMLRSCISCSKWETAFSRLTSNVDNATSFPLCNHLSRRTLRTQKGAFEVDIQNCIPACLLKVFKWFHDISDSSIVHHNIQASEYLNRLINHAFDLIGLSYITWDSNCFTTLILDLSYNTFHFIRSTDMVCTKIWPRCHSYIRYYHITSVIRQIFNDSLTYPSLPARASDYSGFSF